jgi:hypothetical protein
MARLLYPLGKKPSVLIVQEAGRAVVSVWTFRIGEKCFVLLEIEPVSLGCPGKMTKTMGMNRKIFYVTPCSKVESYLHFGGGTASIIREEEAGFSSERSVNVWQVARRHMPEGTVL